MAKCKNCLHLDVCNGLYFNLDQVVERTCRYFKERSEYVKAVRCEKCENRKTDNCPMYSEEYVEWEDEDGTDRDLVTHDRTIDCGFCHLGERNGQ